MGLLDYLKPETTVERPPSGQDVSRYVWSYLVLRLIVGAVGVALPILLVFIDGVLYGEHPFFRDSLSAYYYSGVRDLFVGGLCATGVFLIAYKVADHNGDNRLSTVAGVAALVVALCPTERPSDKAEKIDLTPLQAHLHEGVAQGIHFSAAGIFIVSLGVISFYFGMREGEAPQRGKRSPRFWRNFHRACSGVIALAVLWMLVTAVLKQPRTHLLIGETASVWAFGVSWFWKGFELDALRRSHGG